MYLEIDEGYWEHPKTLDLCARLGDDRADTYPPRLWKWATRSARSGKLGLMSDAAIETAVRYAPKDGRCASALIAAGFIDRSPDGSAEIHDWMDFTGGAIKRMEDEARRKKEYRDSRRAERESASDVHGMSAGQSAGHPRTNPTQSSPVQSSPVQTREEETSRARSNPPANEPGKPTAFNVVSQFLAIRAELLGAGGKNLFAQPANGDVEKCSQWLASMLADDCADIEPAIRLACKHVAAGDQGWTHPDMAKTCFLFGAIVRSWPDLREELHGCAPVRLVPKQKHEDPQRRSTPVKEW
jgi:hypothetical protein